MKMVTFEIIIDVVFRNVIVVVVVVVVVVYCEGPTLNPVVRIIIGGVIDEVNGPVIMERRIMVGVVKIIIDVVFGIWVAVIVVVVAVNCEGPALSCLILHPTVWIIIVGVEEAKGPIIGVRGLDTVAITIIVK